MGRVIKCTPPPAVLTSISLDGKHVLEFNESTHRYKLDGERVPGATTIGSVYPKGEGLIRWMIQQGIVEYEQQSALNRGGGVGTFLHNFAELYEQQKDSEFNWAAVGKSPYEKDVHVVIDRFLAWRSINPDKVTMMEALCASPALHVGGRIDTLRRRGSALVLSDYKTSKGIYISHLIQVIGGYRRMLREWYGIEPEYVEIVKFPKQPELATEVLTADAEGWVLNGKRTDVPGLFGQIEAQFERNLGTYRFQKDIEAKIAP